MRRYYKALIIIPLVVLVVLGGLYFYLNYSVRVEPSSDLSSETVHDDSSVVEVGTVEVSTDSLFDRIDGGHIYYTEKGSITTAKVSSDEMVIACTDQQLEGATELDFAEIRSIRIVAPDTVSRIISTGTSIIVLANQVDSEYIAHTIAVSDLSLCVE